MTFEDRLSIRTPEGIEISVTLAGLGSRIAASLVDSTIQVVVLVIATVGAAAAGDVFDSVMVVFGLTGLMWLGLMLGYFVVFEVLNHGRTPGKAMFHIRVIAVDGQPVGFGQSMVRNLLRLVDLFPLFPVLGPIAILASERNQRIGDLAAGTVVVRDRTPTVGDVAIPVLDPAAQTWDVSAVTPDELEMARRYVRRRAEILPAKRESLAANLAGRLRRRVPGIPPGADDDWVIGQVVAAKHARGQG